MFNEDTVQYAIDHTRVLHAPERRIATFGQTSFRFFLITELMDSVNQVRVRDGRLHAERPQIITPTNIQQMLLEGFGERAEEFVGWLRENAPQLAMLKYGFQFRKTDMSDQIIHSPVEEVVSRLRETVNRSEDPLSAIIEGVDEGWEICLLKFAADLIQESAGENLGDFRQRGLL
ncbi:MAG: hypothetical protein QOE70_2354 [Chthoniobacter sp.]|jgi:hypothetical protein|nr:hypothetical protein [Chthoniobacter sp.]